jgi:hypothetical protein
MDKFACGVVQPVLLNSRAGSRPYSPTGAARTSRAQKHSPTVPFSLVLSFGCTAKSTKTTEQQTDQFKLNALILTVKIKGIKP